MSAAVASPAPTRADKIAAAITEAIIAVQRSPGSSSTAWVDTTATLEAMAEVAARIAFQTQIAVTAADGGEFAEWVADRIHQNFRALRKSSRQASFRSGAQQFPLVWNGEGKEMDDRLQRGCRSAGADLGSRQARASPSPWADLHPLSPFRPLPETRPGTMRL